MGGAAHLRWQLHSRDFAVSMTGQYEAGHPEANERMGELKADVVKMQFACHTSGTRVVLE